MTTDEFLADQQGRRFRDVVEDARVDFAQVLQLLDDPARRQRMVDAELVHNRPALAGVIAEIESLPDVDHFFKTEDGHRTFRFRQAVGVAIRIVMEKLGWQRTGLKGSLGRRAKVSAGTTRAGAYRNISGTSLWFNRAERYAPPPTRSEAKDLIPTRPTGAGSGSPIATPAEQDDYAQRALRALQRVEQIGTEEERRQTCEELMEALRATRAAEGRPF